MLSKILFYLRRVLLRGFCIILLSCYTNYVKPLIIVLAIIIIVTISYYDSESAILCIVRRSISSCAPVITTYIAGTFCGKANLHGIFPTKTYRYMHGSPKRMQCSAGNKIVFHEHLSFRDDVFTMYDIISCSLSDSCVAKSVDVTIFYT